MAAPVVSPWIAVRIGIAIFFAVFGLATAFRSMPASPASFVGSALAAMGLGFLWLVHFAEKR